MSITAAVDGVAGHSNDLDEIKFLSEGFDWGSISMRNVVFGELAGVVVNR